MLGHQAINNARQMAEQEALLALNRRDDSDRSYSNDADDSEEGAE